MWPQRKQKENHQKVDPLARGAGFLDQGEKMDGMGRLWVEEEDIIGASFSKLQPWGQPLFPASSGSPRPQAGHVPGGLRSRTRRQPRTWPRPRRLSFTPAPANPLSTWDARPRPDAAALPIGSHQNPGACVSSAAIRREPRQSPYARPRHSAIGRRPEREKDDG